MSPAAHPTYTILATEGQTFLALFIPGRTPLSASDDHPRFDTIMEKLKDATALQQEGLEQEALSAFEAAADLFDLSEVISKKFEKLSDRISLRSGHVYLDNDPIDNALSEHLLRTYDAGEDFGPLAAFYERLLSNPLGHAREALYPWIQANPLTITEEGLVVGYKSVYSFEDENGETAYKPTRDGEGIVNGVEVQPIIQRPGDIVEMPRSIVLHAPSEACAEGLHIGTWDYAKYFSGDTVLEVHFDPRDVVSVPNNANKIRVCRYKVVGPLDKQYSEPVLHADEYDENDYCPECGELYDDCHCEEEEESRHGDLDYSEFEDGNDVSDLVDSVEEAVSDMRDALGRFVAGRKSKRDPNTGRFIG